ncbi:hypothetical protein [Nibribacter koreensis]|uniref:Uncharacterized protein n=1 Tax=Nibribacter koreensis TaxID=1084519 RepID=A0ABP8FGX9_9BACT
MNKKTFFYILVGVAVVLGVLFKNQFLLEKRIGKENDGLSRYSFDNIELLLPKDTVETIDTSYLSNGDVFCVTRGIGSNKLPSNGVTQYGLSIATFSEDATNDSSFHQDSLKNNLNNTLSQRNDFRLISLKTIKLKDKDAISYEGHRGDLFERAVVFNHDNVVYSINMVGPNLESSTYQKILESIKIKIVR